MKELSITIFTNFVRVLGVVGLCSSATVGTAFASGVIVKPFEIGEGTPQPHSNARAFNIPCGTEEGIAATVKFQREGPVSGSNDIPIIIELREPDTAPGQEGPVVETKSAKANKTEQTVVLHSLSSNRGCSLPWRVRVRYANEGTAPLRTFGSIKLSFDDRVRTIDRGGAGAIGKGASVTSKLGDVSGLEQGKIEITANWYHSIGGSEIQGPNAIRFKWELIDPSGTVVKTVEAYSSNELRSELPKFKLTYQVTKCTPGQWKLKITNLSPNDDARIEEENRKFTPGCPN